MRLAPLSLIAALSVAAAVASANAAPTGPAIGRHDANIVPIAGGCGYGSHPTRWGECVPFRHHRVYRPYRDYDQSYVEEWDEYDYY